MSCYKRIHCDIHRASRAMTLIALIATLTTVSTRLRADSSGSCGGATTTIPFNDVQGNIFFCAIAEAYFSGLTYGTSSTTYGPSDTVPQEQMAAAITRTLDLSLKRGSMGAALDQWWTEGAARVSTHIGDSPRLVKSDGADLWVANLLSNTVSRVRASDGRLLGTWTGATFAYGILVARGRVFVTGDTSPAGRLYSIDPTGAPAAVSLVTNALGDRATGIAYDGTRIWTANNSSISIVNFSIFGPPSVTTISAGFNAPNGILYDGANIWVTDYGDHTLKRLNADGSIAQSIPMSGAPRHPVFDGTNIWVPCAVPGSITVVRATGALSGTVMATLTGNGIDPNDAPMAGAFDGQRVLITNRPDSASLWKAAELTPLGSFGTGIDTAPFGACSDGLNFWITLEATDRLARF